MKKPSIQIIIHRYPLVTNPKGYDAKGGWNGQMPNGEWRHFDTEEEYVREFFDELEKATKE